MVSAVWHYKQFKPVNKAAAACSRAFLALAGPRRGAARQLTPDYDFGCKRPTFSNTYFRTFTKDECAPRDRRRSTTLRRRNRHGATAGRRNRHPGAGNRVQPLGSQLPGHRGDRPRRAATSESGGATTVSRPTRAYRFPYFPNFLTLASPYSYSGCRTSRLSNRNAAHGATVR